MSIASCVIALFVLFALMLFVAGGGLVGAGIAMLLHGDIVGGLVGAAMGASVLFGAYSFARVAWRTKRQSGELPASAISNRRRRARSLLALLAAVTASGLLLPVPLPVRLISIVCAVMVLPVLLAREFEPAKRARHRG
jgi:hypothetical protein